MKILMIMFSSALLSCGQADVEEWSLPVHYGCGDVALVACDTEELRTRCLKIDVPFSLAPNDEPEFGALEVDFTAEGVLRLQQGENLSPLEGCCGVGLEPLLEVIEEELEVLEVQATFSVEPLIDDFSPIEDDDLGLAHFKAETLRFQSIDGTMVNLEGLEIEEAVGCHKESGE